MNVLKTNKANGQTKIHQIKDPMTTSNQTNGKFQNCRRLLQKIVYLYKSSMSNYEKCN